MEILARIFPYITQTDIIIIVSFAISITLFMTWLITMLAKKEEKTYYGLPDHADIPLKSRKGATVRRHNFTAMITIWEITKEYFTVSLEFEMGTYEPDGPMVKLEVDRLILDRKADGFYFNEMIQGINFPFPYHVHARKWHGKKRDTLQIRIDPEEEQHILRQPELASVQNRFSS